MVTTHTTPMLAFLMLGVSCTTLADMREDRGNRQDFIGVFHPEIVGISYDTTRCPDATHPWLFEFEGNSFTTLGFGRFTQSHCEDNTHSSFRRGKLKLTTVDGEILYGVYKGQLLPTPTTATDGVLVIGGTYRNTGGTGRLSRARGAGISGGTINTLNGEAIITVSGSL